MRIEVKEQAREVREGKKEKIENAEFDVSIQRVAIERRQRAKKLIQRGEP